MTLIELCAGIGGLGIACERALCCRTVAQLDIDAHTARIRRRHWPDGEQITADLRGVDGTRWRGCDVVAAGFPCQDLSYGGSQRGLDGDRSGLYFDVVRFVAAVEPSIVVLENTPALLTRHRDVVDQTMAAAGYGLTWVRVSAAHVGAPHIRQRVFVIGRRGVRPSSVIDMGTVSRDDVPWPTPTAGGFNDGESVTSWEARWAAVKARRHGDNGNGFGEPLGIAVRRAMWPTPTAGDSKSSGGRDITRGAYHPGTSLTDATVRDPTIAPPGYRLNPDWVEQLIGLPVGWTRDTGPRLDIDDPPPWPAPRGCKQYPHEVPRTIEPVTGQHRTRRLRMLGNSVVWTQAAWAIRTAMAPPQPSLW